MPENNNDGVLNDPAPLRAVDIKPYQALEECCQLHESIEVYYAVDGYVAQVIIGDGATPAVSVHGETIAMALLNLDNELRVKGYTLERIRKTRDLTGAKTWMDHVDAQPKFVIGGPTIVLQPGQAVHVQFAGCDGVISTGFFEDRIKVEADLPDGQGRKGVIYEEIFNTPGTQKS